MKPMGNARTRKKPASKPRKTPPSRTSRRRGLSAAGALGISGDQYRTIFDALRDMVHVVDRDLRIVYFNAAFRKSVQELGHDADTLIGKNLLETFPFAVDRLSHEYTQVLETGRVLVTAEALSLSGSEYQTETTKVPLVQGSKVVGVVTIISNVTPHKQTEQRLRESEELYRKIVDHSIDGIGMGQDGYIIHMNDAASRMFGYESGELIGKSMFSVVAPESQATIRERAEARFRGLKVSDRYEFVGLRKDGTKIPIEVSSGDAFLHNDKPTILTVFRDMSLPKQAEETLRSSEERWRSLVQNAPSIIFILDRQERIQFINRTVPGFSREHVIGTSACDYVPEEFRELQMRAFTRVFQTGEPESYEIMSYGPQGTMVWYSNRVGPLRQNGQIVGLVVVATDIDERKRAEQARRDSEGKYRRLVEQSLQGLVITQGDPPRIVFINLAGSKILGSTPDELLSLSPEGVRKMVPPHEQEVFFRRYRDRAAGNVQPESYEAWVIRKDGSRCCIEVQPGQIEYLGGRAMQATFIDITMRKQAEEALRDSEEKYRSLVEQSLQGLVIVQGVPLRPVFVNPAVAEIVGYTLDELLAAIPEGVARMIPPECQADLLQRYQDRLAGKPVPRRYEASLIHKNGTLRWVEVLASRIEFRGAPAVQATFIDVTERKKVEEALHKSELRYRSLAEAAHDMIYIIGRDDRIEYVNSFAAKNLGIPAAELIGTPREELFPLDEALRQRRSLDEVFRTGEPRYTETTIPFQGREFWIGSWLSPLTDETGEVTSVLGISRDTTERKQIEEQLVQSEERYRCLAETARDMIFIIDANDCVEYVNQFGAELLGRRPEDIIDGPRENLFPPDVSRHQKQRLEEVFKTGQALSVVDRNPLGDTELWLDTHLVPLRDESGKVRSVLGISRDVTERRQAEETLKESERRYRSLVDNISDGVFALGTEGYFTFVNKAVEERSGLPQEKMQRLRFQDILLPECRELAERNFQRTLSGEEVSAYEVKYRTATGAVREVEISGGPIFRDGRIAGVQAISRDITERKQKEEELSRSREQLRALAAALQSVREEERTHVAREIHDELGQVLTALKMDVAWVEGKLSGAGPKVEQSALIEKLRSMGVLTDETIQVVRRIVSELRPGILDDLGLVAALDWQSKDFQKRTGIECGFFCPDELVSVTPEISTAVFRIFQEALTNVVRHAQATKVRVTLSERPDSLVLEVEDNGKGITDEDAHASRSLGLLGMRERASLLGGEMRIKGQSGKGTTVTVEIPRRGHRSSSGSHSENPFAERERSHDQSNHR